MLLCRQRVFKPTGTWEREPTASLLCNTDLRKAGEREREHMRALYSLADQHKEAEAERKDNTSCLIPSAFSEIGLGSLKIIAGLLQRATGLAHIFLLSRKPCKVLNVAERSGQRSNCYFQVALSSKWHYWDQGLWRILASGISHRSSEEIKALVQGGV